MSDDGPEVASAESEEEDTSDEDCVYSEEESSSSDDEKKNPKFGIAAFAIANSPRTLLRDMPVAFHCRWVLVKDSRVSCIRTENAPIVVVENY